MPPMAKEERISGVDEKSTVEDTLVHLARLSLSGREQDVALYMQRLARKMRATNPAVADELIAVLRDTPTRSSPLRRETAVAVPVDTDSRLELVRVEHPQRHEYAPILSKDLTTRVQLIVDERTQRATLAEAGLSPTRTALLTGPPGVGKTLVARWLAAQLRVPLLVLDLSAVMSSFLGRTGVNLRHVLDYAKATDCVLLIDEIDSIGKRRDDDTDVGELKRLVNVLLQQVDDWPVDAGLLLAATNHPELLDPAIWRRFEAVLDFPLPNSSARRLMVDLTTGGDLPDELATAVVSAFDGSSFSDLETAMSRARRAAALKYGTFADCVADACSDHIARLDSVSRRRVAMLLLKAGISQRRTQELTGISRDTLRKDTQPPRKRAASG